MKFFLLLNSSIVALAGDCSEKKKCYRQCQQMANDMMRDCLNWYPGELKKSLICMILYDINFMILYQNCYLIRLFLAKIWLKFYFLDSGDTAGFCEAMIEYEQQKCNVQQGGFKKKYEILLRWRIVSLKAI